MEAWDNLVAAALLGTERRTFKLEIEGESAGALKGLEAADAESILLKAAAILATYRRAGYVPIADKRPLPPAAEPETLPACSPNVVRYLRMLMETPQIYQELLTECLQLLAQAGKRVPHQSLPDVIQLAHGNSRFLPAVALVVGQRGLWLIGQHPEWSRKSEHWSPTALLELPTFEPANLWAIPLANPQEAALVERLRDGNIPMWNRLYELSNYPSLWTDTLIALFAELVKEINKTHVNFGSYSATITARIPPALISTAITKIRDALGSQHSDYFEPLIDLLELRLKMLQELTR
jgi:hypothetical protein